MAAFCLTKQTIERFKEGLRSREIDPLKMASLSSEERNTFIAKYVGKENAQAVNSLFESKLLLKNQKAGYISWAKKIGGITPEVRRDLISRIEKLDKVLSPKDEQSFLHDLATTRLGVDVKPEEAKTIFDLSQAQSELKKVWQDKLKANPDVNWSKDTDRLKWGAARVDLMNYVNKLKEEAQKGTLSENLNPVKAVSNIAGIAKSIKASFDDSAVFRQGWRTIWTHPDIWAKHAITSLSDIVRSLGNRQVMDGIMADIVSRPNYDQMVKAKLAIGNLEEAFPTTLPEKVPLFGRVYKSSEVAYTGFLYRMRADIFDRYIQLADNSGVNLKDIKQVQSIGKLVNSLTGRGDLGPFEKQAGAVNNIFFSPRNIKSQVDQLTLHAGDKDFSSFARKESAVNLVKIIVGTAGVLAIAKAVNPKSVETDMRSSDFGKIRVGDTRFDVTGGMAPLITLAARLITQSSKSSTSGIVTPLNSGAYGAQTEKDVVYNFFENKLSPVASVVRDLLKGKDYQGNKPTIAGEASNMFMPLTFTNYQELSSNPHAANIVLAMIADSLGIATNTYSQNPKDWSQTPTKEQSAFLNKVGPDKFKRANDEYNTHVAGYVSTIKQSDKYKALNDTEKKAVLDQAKKNVEAGVMKKYGFVYKQPKSGSTKDERAKIKSFKP